MRRVEFAESWRPTTAGRSLREANGHLTPSIRKMVTGISVFCVVCFVAVTGYMVGGWSFGDAFYMVIITIFGVGYGEVLPVQTGVMRGLTMLVIVVGYGSVIYTVGGFIQLMLDGELNKALGARRMSKDIDRLTDHVIICGFGRMGASLARELAAAGRPFVAIDTAGGAFPDGEQDHLVVTGDATEEAVLERAGIDRATVLAAVLSDDASNAFVTLTARTMNPALTIIARGEQAGTAAKLRTCGADRVVMPTTIGATRISELILRPGTQAVFEELAGGDDHHLQRIGLVFSDVPVVTGSPVEDRALGEIQVRGEQGHLVVALRRACGETLVDPGPRTTLRAGDTIVALGHADDPPTATPLHGATTRTITYRGVTNLR